MKIEKLLPYHTALDLSKFKEHLASILKKESFCIESYFAYVDRHKGQVNKDEVLKIFQKFPKILALEFIREVIRNYLQINGTIKLDIYKVSLLENKDIKTSISKSVISNLYAPIYNNSITGRLYSEYQRWGNVNGKHLLQQISGENVFSVDVDSCILSVYINFLKKMKFNIDETYNKFYNGKVDFYLYFIVKTFLPALIDNNGNYHLNEIKEYYRDKQHIIKQIAEFIKYDYKGVEQLIDVLRTAGKKIIIPLIFQGQNNMLASFAKIMGFYMTSLENKVYGRYSVLQFGKWNQYIDNFIKNFKKSSILSSFYSLYIPKCSYLKDKKKLASYILENISNYSIMSSILKLLLDGIEIKGYYFDEIYIPIEHKNKIIDIKNIFLSNNLVPLRVSESF